MLVSIAALAVNQNIFIYNFVVLQDLHAQADPHLQDVPQHDDVIFELEELDTLVLVFVLELEFTSFPHI